jgi:hypothetical protein
MFFSTKSWLQAEIYLFQQFFFYHIKVLFISSVLECIRGDRRRLYLIPENPQ